MLAFVLLFSRAVFLLGAPFIRYAFGRKCWARMVSGLVRVLRRASEVLALLKRWGNMF